MRQLGKRILSESILADSIPDDIRQCVLQNRTSLGNNPAIPDVFDVPYLLKAVNSEFEASKEALRNIGTIDDVDDTDLTSALAKLILKCKRIEAPYRNELEKICYNFVIDFFSVPEDAVDLSLELCDEVDTERESVILDPKDGNDELEFNDINDAMSIRDEVFKRRFLDALCMGMALTYSDRLADETNDSLCEEIAGIDESLPLLYNKITSLSKYLLFSKEDFGMTDENKLQSGTFELTLGNDDEKCRIEAQGEIFPFLLCETIRGFLELFISHGLPEDKNRAIAVLGKSDFLKAEPWDMRIGPHLWKMVSKSFTDIEFKDIPYLFKRISSLDTHKFNFLMKEVLAGTKKGRRIMAFLCNKAKDDSEYDKFVDRMDKMKKDKGIITDDYIHPDEL